MAFVTIVMPAFNASAYIKKSIDSILAQTFEDWELIICDDGSTDDTAQIISDYSERESRIKILKMPENSGFARMPRLEAISHSRTEWVCSIDSDDSIEPSFLSLQVSRQKESSADIVLCEMSLVREGQLIRKIPNSEFDKNRIISGKEACFLTIGKWQIGANGALIKRKLYANVLNYINNDVASDEVDARIIFSKADKIAFSNACYFYLLHPTSVTHKLSPRYFTKTTQAIRLFEFLAEAYPNDLYILRTQWENAYDTLYECCLQYYWNRHLWPKEDNDIYSMIRGNFKELVKNNHYIENGKSLFNILLYNYSFFSARVYLRFLAGRFVRFIKIK